MKIGFAVMAASISVSAVQSASPGAAQEQVLAPRRVADRTLPVPDTISPAMRNLVALPLNPRWNHVPASGEAWRDFSVASGAKGAQTSAVLAQRMHVTIARSTMGGVPVFVVTPETIARRNRGRLLINFHGGCYVMFPGLSGTTEAILMAGIGGIRVVAVDYRMSPAAYFPAALDDAVAVWKAALTAHDRRRLGVFGTSAGGALSLALVLRTKQLGLSVPAAVAAGSPMADLTGAGDTHQTNAMVDNTLVSPDGVCTAAANLYAHGHDLRDPLLSPVYGDFKGFPPTILTSGTRDLLLSDTVRVHRALREAGATADLQVFEAQSHAQFLQDDQAPETKQVFGEIARFFDRTLAH